MNFLTQKISTIILLIILSSCNSTDNEAPIIEILSPKNNSQHAVLDDIIIKLKVSDNENLKTVNALLSIDNSVVANKGAVLSTKDTIVELYMQLNDIRTQEGTYTLLITANDGENESKASINIQLKEVPLQQVGWLCLENNSIGAILRFYDESFNFKDELTLNNQVENFYFDHYQKIVLVHYKNHEIASFDWGNKKQIWTTESISSFDNTVFKSMCFVQPSIYVIDEFQKCYQFDTYGNHKWLSNINFAEQISHNVDADKTVLLTKSSTSYNIGLLNIKSNTITSNQNINTGAIFIYSGNNSIWTYHSYNTEYKLINYNYNDLIESRRVNIDDSSIIQLLDFKNDQLLALSKDKKAYLITNKSLIAEAISSTNIDFIFKDRINQNAYAISKSKLLLYNTNDNDFEEIHSFNYEVSKTAPIYNY